MKAYWRRLLFATLLGVLIYGFFIAYSGYREIEQSMRTFHGSAFAVALLLATANYLLRFVKWEYYLARLGIRGVPRWDSLLIFLSGFVLTITPGKVGEVFKSAILAGTHGVPIARTAPIVIAERLTDVIGVVVLIIIGSASFSGGIVWAALGGLAVASGLVLILWPVPALYGIGRLERTQSSLRRFAPKLRQAYESLRVVAAPSALIVPTLLSIAAWAAEGCALYVLLRGFDLQASVTLATFFYATATLAGALIPVPGGLGVTEAMLREQLVRLEGLPEGPATASMILVRFATLWWAVLVGFMALGLLKRRYPRLFDGSGAVAPAPPESGTLRGSA